MAVKTSAQRQSQPYQNRARDHGTATKTNFRALADGDGCHTDGCVAQPFTVRLIV